MVLYTCSREDETVSREEKVLPGAVAATFVAVQRLVIGMIVGLRTHQYSASHVTTEALVGVGQEALGD